MTREIVLFSSKAAVVCMVTTIQRNRQPRDWLASVDCWSVSQEVARAARAQANESARVVLRFEDRSDSLSLDGLALVIRAFSSPPSIT